MRRTQKRVAAEQAAREYLGYGDVAAMIPNQSLYADLQKGGYVWDTWKSAWVKGRRAANGEPLSNSEFMTVSGQPSGVVKIRLMGHPADLHTLANLIKEATPRLTVISVSDEYPNRKGVGTRIYIDAMLK